MGARENLYFKRQETKTSDGEFVYELINSYELSIKLSEQILLSAKEILLRESILKEGQIEVTVIEIEQRSGKTIEKMEKKKGTPYDRCGKGRHRNKKGIWTNRFAGDSFTENK